MILTRPEARNGPVAFFFWLRDRKKSWHQTLNFLSDTLGRPRLRLRPHAASQLPAWSRTLLVDYRGLFDITLPYMLRKGWSCIFRQLKFNPFNVAHDNHLVRSEPGGPTVFKRELRAPACSPAFMCNWPQCLAVHRNVLLLAVIIRHRYFMQSVASFHYWTCSRVFFKCSSYYLNQFYCIVFIFRSF